MRRLLFTVATACSLTGLYAVYAALTRPLFPAPTKAAPQAVAPLEDGSARPA